MIPLSLGQIAAITGGTLLNANPAAMVTGAVEFDSRAITPGGLFVALVGNRVDGHNFAAAAQGEGAVAALVTKPIDTPAIMVADALIALGKLARAVVDQLPQLTIIGITGSSGKTSTKDLVAHLISDLGNTVAAPGSFNNELGHPYTVLKADGQTRYLVLEVSARGLGHIHWLTQVAPPQIGVVLNVGTAHVGEFGSEDITARAKAELVAALPAADNAGAGGGVAILNADDHRVAAMAATTSARVVYFGRSKRAQIQAQDIALDDAGRPMFSLVTPQGAASVRLRLYGEHQVDNALAAAAVALELGMPLDAVANKLATATARSNGRMEVMERSDGVVIIDDAYNANPDSTKAALRALRQIAERRSRLLMRPVRTWAILGLHAELGERTESEHAAIGSYAAALGVDRLVVIGDVAEAIITGAQNPSWHGDAILVPNVDTAIATLATAIQPGDVVLVKASHSAGLTAVAHALLNNDSLADAAEVSS